MKKIQWVLLILIFLVAVLVRLRGYTKLTYSVGVRDTDSYLQASEVAFPSWQFFTSPRSATIPLLYKILRPEKGYQITVIGDPAKSTPASLKPQQGFNRVVIFQIAVAIFSWSCLVLVLFYRLRNPLVKVAIAFLVLSFAYVPQMADWDNVLNSESLSFSLHALLIALVIELAFTWAQDRAKAAWLRYALMGLIFLVMVAWVFTRDTNAYLLLFSSGILMVCLLLAVWRKIAQVKPLVVLLVLFLGLFIFQQVTFRASERWLLPFLNNMTAYVLRYPSRVAFFERRGMPVTPELLRIRGAAEKSGIYEQAEFLSWARQRGLSAYTQFLFSNPGWAISLVYNDLEYVFNENIQPYFREFTRENVPEHLRPYTERPEWLAPYGNLLHPISSGIVLVDLILALVLVGQALRLHTSEARIWAGVGAWLFLGGVILLLVGYLGEVRSIVRHAQGGIVPLRLALWLLLAMVAEVSGSRHEGTA